MTTNELVKEALTAATMRGMPSSWTSRYSAARTAKGRPAVTPPRMLLPSNKPAAPVAAPVAAQAAPAPAPAPVAPAPVPAPAPTTVAGGPAPVATLPKPAPISGMPLSFSGASPSPAAKPAVADPNAAVRARQRGTASKGKTASLAEAFMDELDKTAESKRRRNLAALGSSLGLLGILGGIPLYRGIRGFRAVKMPSRAETIRQMVKSVKQEGFPLSPLETRRAYIEEGAIGKELSEAIKRSRKHYGRDYRAERLHQLGRKLKVGADWAKSPYRMHEVGPTILKAILTSVLAGAAGRALDQV